MRNILKIGSFPFWNKSLTIVITAVEQGTRVLIADLRLTSAAEVYISQAGSSKVVFVKTDVSKRADLENLITVSEKEFGDVPDIYICGAAVFEPVCHLLLSFRSWFLHIS